MEEPEVIHVTEELRTAKLETNLQEAILPHQAGRRIKVTNREINRVIEAITTHRAEATEIEVPVAL